MANAYTYSNTAVQTTLSGNISNAAASVVVGATTGFPPTYPYVLAIDYGAATEELVTVTAAAGTTLTVTRGFGGTSAQSHSLGAVVRHVYNSVDATDFRTHEAATGDVHGVTGALVGATMAQTLTNKTLTNPTVNGGALSGTFSGAHTLSGAVTMSGGGTLTGTFTGSPTLSGAPTFSGNATFSGSPTAQTVTGEIAHSNLHRGTRALATDSQYESRVTGDTNARWFTQADGKHYWGSGSAPGDTDLYRSAAATLKTDGAFVVGTGLTVADTTWTAFTPTWTGIGTATLAQNRGWYYKLGKIVFIEIFGAFNGAGSGTAGIQLTLPSVPFREGGGANTTRQMIPGWADAMNIMSPGWAYLPIFAGDVGATSGALRMYDQSVIQGQHIQNGTIFTVEGWYREA